MAAGSTTVQEVLEALAEQVATMPEVKAAHANDIRVIQRFPTVIFRWFSDVDTVVTEGSTQMWIVNAKAILFTAAIVGNNPGPSVADTNNLIHKLVDKINIHPHMYPFGSKMAALDVSRVLVTRVRPAEFGLEYAGHRYFGAELFLDIKMHRRVSY